MFVSIHGPKISGGQKNDTFYSMHCVLNDFLLFSFWFYFTKEILPDQFLKPIAIEQLDSDP